MTEMYQITGNIKGEFACYLGGSLKGDLVRYQDT